MTWEELLPEISSHIEADNASALMFSGILYLIIGFGFFGTIMMMTAERKFEFGMLIAIGMKKTKLSLILLGETFLITILGICFGFLISIPVVIYFMAYPIRFTGEWGKAWEKFGFEPVMPAAFDPSIFMNQSIIVFILALIIGLYPFWHIRRINPVTAMK
jgi:ABC-type antimicrobial peptide transport system permease subunit